MPMNNICEPYDHSTCQSCIQEIRIPQAQRPPLRISLFFRLSGAGPRVVQARKQSGGDTLHVRLWQNRAERRSRGRLQLAVAEPRWVNTGSPGLAGAQPWLFNPVPSACGFLSNPLPHPTRARPSPTFHSRVLPASPVAAVVWRPPGPALLALASLISFIREDT